MIGSTGPGHLVGVCEPGAGWAAIPPQPSIAQGGI